MDKLQQFVAGELDALRQKGTFYRPRVLQTEQKATVIIDGHEVITLSSNNYLGLTVYPRLREAAIEAINTYGVGSGSVRTIAGTMSLHVELEEKLARFKHTEASRRKPSPEPVPIIDFINDQLWLKYKGIGIIGL